jgi:anthranilate phosphoribosyltransferase
MSLRAFLQPLFNGYCLSQQQAEDAMSIVIEGRALSEEVGALLGAMASRGEHIDEIVGAAAAMRSHATSVAIKRQDLIDVCGTGGDGAHTFNISTTNALLLAAGGLGVVKHGNRAVSSQCGSADVLEALGIRIDYDPSEAGAMIDKCGFAFLFAPFYHPAMKNVAEIRRNLGVRTIFNLIGPLANPAPVHRQVVGVFREALVTPIASALQKLGTRAALVVFGQDGLDELSTTGINTVARIEKDKLTQMTLSPEDFGLPRASLQDLIGGDKNENAKITEAVLRGEKGPRRDIVLMNAAAALVIAGQAENWREGVHKAAQVIDDGRAMKLLNELRSGK